ncbi:MAG: 5-(carboxyamino)imidazole ribonucleotide synthase [Cyanobacteriota bacterium]|nr:5-(carboxyamino)imidazole ribonucleotide synthase [Cyanobacteriota bacterium]
MLRRVGVIGGGQLAQLLALAGQELGIQIWIQTPHPHDPAVGVASGVVWGSLQDAEATMRLAEQVEVITFENEFVDVSALQKLATQGVCFRPSLAALSPVLDKYQQRLFLQHLGLPTPPCLAISHPPTPQQIADLGGFPLVVKARRHGYDGLGTQMAGDPESLQKILHQMGSQPLLLEAYIPFQRELAIVGARSARGEIALYPVVETIQQNQVCRWVVAPAAIPPSVESVAKAILQTILEHLDVVGLFGLELFLTEQDKLLVNEISPRTHNSGHYTLDACATSQFAQHLRAIGDLPLGDPHLTCLGAVMVNLLGFENAESDYPQQRQALAALPQAHLHWYGKSISRPGRKLGHITLLAPPDLAAQDWSAYVRLITQQVAERWDPSWQPFR